MNAFILNGGVFAWWKILACVAIMIWAGNAIREQGRHEGAVACYNQFTNAGVK